MRKLVLAVSVAMAVAVPACGGGDDTPLAAAAVVPGDALAFFSVDLDPATEQQRKLLALLRRFPDARDEVRGSFADARDRLLAEVVEEGGLDFRRDVRPWLGAELAVALLPPGRGTAPLSAILVDTKDEDKAREAMEKARREGDFRGRYRVVENFVVLSEQDDPADDEALLDAVERASKDDEGTLAADKRFTGVVGELGDERLALGFVDARGLVRVGQDLGVLPPQFDVLRQFTGAGTAAFDVHVESSAVVLDAVAEAQPAGDAGTKAGQPRLTRSLPADSLGALTFFDPGGGLSAGLGALVGAGGDPVGALRAQTGIDLEQDVFSWMRGEAVIVAGAAPAGGGVPSFALVVEPTDRAKAEAGVAKVREALRAQGLGLQERRVGDVTALVVPRPFEEGLQPAMALFPDRFVVASRPEYLPALARASSPGFGESEAYRAVVGEGERSSSFQVVVRIDSVREAFERVMPPEERAAYEADVRPNLEPLEAFGVTSRQDGKLGRIRVKVTID